MLGHLASSQTVAKPNSRTVLCNVLYSSDVAGAALSHAGLGNICAARGTALRGRDDDDEGDWDTIAVLVSVSYSSASPVRSPGVGCRDVDMVEPVKSYKVSSGFSSNCTRNASKRDPDVLVIETVDRDLRRHVQELWRK
jgi:hypothetical protein